MLIPNVIDIKYKSSIFYYKGISFLHLPLMPTRMIQFFWGKGSSMIVLISQSTKIPFSSEPLESLYFSIFECSQKGDEILIDFFSSIEKNCQTISRQKIALS